MRDLVSRTGSVLTKRVVQGLLRHAVRRSEARPVARFTGVEPLEQRVMLAAEAVVAVLDTGANITSTTMFPFLWVNNKETPNLADDDLNGYTDDLYGWNTVSDSSDVLNTGHGDSMARTILAAAQAVATATGSGINVKILPVVTATAMTDIGSIGGGTWIFSGGATGIWTLNFAGATWRWQGPGNSGGPTAGNGVWTYTLSGPSPDAVPQTANPGSLPWTGDWNRNSGAAWEYVPMSITRTVTNLNTSDSLGRPLGTVTYTNDALPNITNNTWVWTGPGSVVNDDWSPTTSSATLGTWVWTATGPGPGILPGASSAAPESSGPGTGSHQWDPVTSTWSWNSVVSGNNGNTFYNQMLTGGTWDDVIEGINYVVTQKRNGGANIVALTLNNGGYYTTTAAADFTVNALKAAIENATRAGIAVFIGAGNSTLNNDVVPNFPANLATSNNLAISVAAADVNGNFSGFSNFGPNNVEITAPGDSLSIPNVTGSVSGTDYATAWAAGTLAGVASAKGIGASTAYNQILNVSRYFSALDDLTVTGKFFTTEGAQQAVAGERPLSYALDVLNSSTISGWAYDANAASNISNITIRVNGVDITTFAANTNRPDLAPYFSTTTHGFNFSNLGAYLTPGLNTVQVFGSDKPANLNSGESLVLLGSATIVGNQIPIGVVDQADGNIVSGWVLDPNTLNSSTTVRFVIDGSDFGTFLASGSRPDVAAIYGGSGNFGFAIDTSALAVGPHRVDIYMADTTTGQEFLLASRAFVKNNLPFGAIDLVTRNQIIGWGVDLDDQAGALQYRVEVNGVAMALQTSNINRTDLETAGIVTAGNGANKGFALTLPALAPGANTVRVVGIDANTKGEVVFYEQTLYGNRTPVGAIDSVGSQLIGWAADPDSLAPIKVRIDIDSSTGVVFTANGLRPDLAPIFGASQFGVVRTMPELTPGDHVVKLYAFDAETNQEVLIGTKNITTATTLGASNRPTGAVTSISATSVSGWAYDADLGASAAQVRIDIVNSAGVTTTGTPFSANAAVGGLPVGVVGTNHGFTQAITPPTGAFTVLVYVLNSPTNQPVLLRSATFNNTPASGTVSATLATISGTAALPGTANPRVRIDVNDVVGNVFTATGGNFSIATPPLSAASNSVKLYVIETGSEQAVLVASTTVAANSAPMGFVDVLNESLIIGWAVDADDVATSVQIVININGVDAEVITANESRPDLAAFGNTNLGFEYSFVTSTYAAGVNLVTVKAVDNQTGIVVVLATQELTLL